MEGQVFDEDKYCGENKSFCGWFAASMTRYQKMVTVGVDTCEGEDKDDRLHHQSRSGVEDEYQRLLQVQTGSELVDRVNRS